MGVYELPASPRPRRRLLRAGAAFVVLCALAGYVVVQYTSGDRMAPGCRVVSADGGGRTYELGADQAVNAATISAVGTSRGMPERAVTIALATALQESGLRNLDHGDRDSVGLFQQRPSQGWGSAGQIMDPVYSASRFYARLDKIPGYAHLPLTVAAQQVQRSGFPEAYAKHEPDATVLSAALTGHAAASLTCSGTVRRGPGDPARVRAALIHDFGKAVLPEPGGAKSAAASGTPETAARPALAPAAHTSPAPGSAAGASPDGGSTARSTRTVLVPVSGAGGHSAGSGGQRGWELAQWAVAHSAELRISQVRYAGREWTADSSGHAWREVAREGTPGSAPHGGTDTGREVLIETAS